MDYIRIITFEEFKEFAEKKGLIFPPNYEDISNCTVGIVSDNTFKAVAFSFKAMLASGYEPMDDDAVGKYVCVQDCPERRHGENTARCSATEAQILEKTSKKGDFCPCKQTKAIWAKLSEFNSNAKYMNLR